MTSQRYPADRLEDEPEQLLRRSDQYWQQAQELLEQNHLEKASELAWGSLVERVKALGIVKSDVRLRSHRDLRTYIKRMAMDKKDEEMYRVYQRAESLHINFYESFFDEDDVRSAIVSIRELLLRIDSVLLGHTR